LFSLQQVFGSCTSQSISSWNKEHVQEHKNDLGFYERTNKEKGMSLIPYTLILQHPKLEFM
jgi:hypothetical protein